MINIQRKSVVTLVDEYYQLFRLQDSFHDLSQFPFLCERSRNEANIEHNSDNHDDNNSTIGITIVNNNQNNNIRMATTPTPLSYTDKNGFVDETNSRDNDASSMHELSSNESDIEQPSPDNHLDALLRQAIEECDRANCRTLQEKLFFAVHMKDDRGYILLRELLIQCGSNKPHLEEIRDLSRDNCTLMHLAAQHNHVKCLQTLVELGFKNVDCRDKLDATPLFYACAHMASDAAIFLLGNGANVNAKDSYGSFPLLIALRNNHLDLMKVLLVYGADIHLKNAQGDTCLHYQCKVNNSKMSKKQREDSLSKIHFLIKDCKVSVGRLNRNSEHALYSALDDRVTIEYLCNITSFYFLSRLLMHKNIDGKTIFHVCCEKGLFRTLITILRCFIEKYNERQKDPESTLQDDISSIMKRRLNEPTTKEAYTVLHLGVKSGHVELVRFLLSCTEVDIEAKDNYSKTALQYAQDMNATDIITLFPTKSAYGRRSSGIGFSRNSARLQIPKDYDPAARRKSLNIQFENNPALLQKVEELVKKRERKRGVISYFFSKIKTSQ